MFPPSAETTLRSLRAGLSPSALAVLEVAKQLVETSGTEALYLVGGTVRDALLDQSGPRPGSHRYTRDLDLLTEGGGGAAALGEALKRTFGGSLTCHNAFLTCTLTLQGLGSGLEPGLELDLATARAEHYPHPGALPEVRAATLGDDLRRRDFSVNTLALRLTPTPHRLFGVPGALSDLQKGVLRILHPASFEDDPTRIVRGSRLAGRLGFAYEGETERRLREALSAGVRVSPARLKHELLLTLAEPQVAPAVTHLAQGGALNALYHLNTPPDLGLMLGHLDALRRAATASKGPAVPDESYLLALFAASEEKALRAHLQIFSWPKSIRRAHERLSKALRGEGLGAGTDAEKSVLRACRPDLAAQLERPLLRGEDVLDLGLPAGQAVGEVLRAVSHARAAGTLASLESELEFARHLVEDLTGKKASSQPSRENQ